MHTMPHRFGMFVHWGIYALSEFHEQYRWKLSVPRKEYATLAERFNPVDFDPEEWVLMAKDAGMEYLCFTTKHHDGFCMWDTQYTDFKVTNTPYGRDVLKMLADACAKHGLALSLYYSIPDWNHPNAFNELSTHQILTEGDVADSALYRKYIKHQMGELLTQYGKIYTLFWDIPPHISDPSINEYVRSLQPDILINDRGYDSGDFSTPERYVPDGYAFERYTEACSAVGLRSWGYRKNEDYYTPKFLCQSLDKILVMGGSYLLNVGPMPNGKVDEKSKSIIQKVGSWYNRVKESFENVECAPELFEDPCYLVTKRDQTVYLHFNRDATACGVSLKPYNQMPRSATVLNNGQKLAFDITTMPEDTDPVTFVLNPPSLHIYDIPADVITHEPIVIKLEL